MGAYEDAMKASIAHQKASQKRTRTNLTAVLDLLDSTGMAPVGESGGNANPTNTSGPASGQSIRGIMEGKYKGTGGPSTGPIPAMRTWNFRGKSVTTAAGTKKYFKPFLRELAAAGYDINSIGGYANRNARGLNRLSEHAYGDAIDINPAQNPMTSAGTLTTDMPANIARIAARHHLVWGGTWKSRKDPMHFSISGY